MDNSASYSKIGLTILVGIALIIGVFVYFGQVGAEKVEIPAETYFYNSVTGLAPGADVCFRGVKVGRVTRISFVATEYPASKNRHAVWVGLAFDPSLCGAMVDDPDPEVRLRRIVTTQNLHTTVASSLLTGISHIEIDVPKTEIDEMPCDWVPRTLCVPPAPTLMESASQVLPALLDKIDQMDIVGCWSNVMTTLVSANALMGTANTLVDSQQGNLAEIFGNLRDTSSALRDLASRLRDNPSLLLRDPNNPSLPETAR